MTRPLRERHRDTIIDLVKEGNVRRFAEIGVYTGSTARVVLDACGDQIERYYLVDPWVLYMPKSLAQPIETQKQYQKDLDNLAVTCYKLMELYKAAKIIRLRSALAATLFEPESLDMVFINGDHSYEAVIGDIRVWQPIVRRGGYLSGHDYGVEGAPWVRVAEAVDEAFQDGEFRILPGFVWVVEKE